MAVMVEHLKPSSKKDNSRSSKTKNNNQQKLSRTSVLEAISKGGNKITSYTAEDGTIKMKILVKKQDLKQILGAMNNVGFRDRPTTVCPPPPTPPPSSTLERRLLELKRKKINKANAQSKGTTNYLSSWRPQLQSIPEERYFI